MPGSPVGNQAQREPGEGYLWAATALVRFLFTRVGVLLIAAAAVVVTWLAFREGKGEGIRAMIFFIIPSLWGAFGLAATDGNPDAWERFGKNGLPALGLIAGLAISTVFIFDAPVSTANLALGAMEASAFMYWVSTRPTRRRIPAGERHWALALLLMVTVICIAIAITV